MVSFPQGLVQTLALSSRCAVCLCRQLSCRRAQRSCAATVTGRCSSQVGAHPPWKVV